MPSSCGGGLFELSPETAEKIGSQGLSFFTNATYGRGYPPDTRLHRAYSYQPWQETPWPADGYSEGSFSVGFYCIGLDRESEGAVRREIGKSGSYWSRRDGGEIVVFPNLRLILVAHID